MKNHLVLSILTVFFLSGMRIRMALMSKGMNTKLVRRLFAPLQSSFRLFGGGKNRDGLGKAKGYSDLNLRYILEKETKSGLPDRTKAFNVLGIESSCDDTGVAVVRSDGTILSNVVYSQYQIHERFGGIVPSLAMEAHKTNIEKAVDEAIIKAGLNSLEDIDAIAVTKGPGLEICLRVGMRKAQALAREFNKPFVTVHHLEAHCILARLAGKVIVDEQKQNNNDPEITNNSEKVLETNLHEKREETLESHFMPKVEYPFLALLASGGHTSILLCKEMGEYSVLGGTLDDALGEAFDKAARLLGLKCASSGGAAVEAAAKGGETTAFSMKVPMRDKPNCDFSYAGLKNAFRLAVQQAREREGLDIDSTNAPAGQMETAPEPVALSDKAASDLCATFQDVAFLHVEDRINRALDYLENNKIDVTSLVVVGGVAANKELRRRLLALLEKRAEPPKIHHSKKTESTAGGLNNINSSTETVSDEKADITDSSATVAATTVTTIPVAAVGPNPIKLIFPPPGLCTDNGVMVAWAGIEKIFLGISDEVEGQEVVARWPLGSPIDGGNAVFKRIKK